MSDVIESQTLSPNFDKLKTELVRNSDGITLYDDTHFPAKFQVLFNKINLEFETSDIIWRRPGQLTKTPHIFKPISVANPTRYYQGKLTPFWFPILISILKERNMVEMIIPNLSVQDTFNQEPLLITPASMTYCGAFQFCFRRGGVLEYVIIDDKLPTTVNCHLLSAISSDTEEFLPALIEKAYAKFVGGYYNLEKETFLGALMDFTGGIAESMSWEIHEQLTNEDIETFYKKIVNMVGESFALCQVDVPMDNENQRKSHKKQSTIYQVFAISGYTEAPLDPPDGLVNDLVNTIQQTRGPFIPVMRLFPMSNLQENNFIDKFFLHKWQKCTSIVKRKYGVECDNKKENWISVQDMIRVSSKIVILHMYYRTSLMALTKKQPFWKYNFYESFWHRDDPRGSIKKLGNNFLENKQYLFVVSREEGCSIKIALTNIQKYIDVGANIIQLGSDTETGIAILEVEKNRLYRVHDVDHVNEHKCHVDFQKGRYLIVSAFLERGCYVIIPWISKGPGTKYTMQIFSSTNDAEITILENDFPKPIFCVGCQLRQAAFETSSKFRSLYQDETVDSTITQENVCDECRSINPKRATRISVIGAQDVKINTTYQLPNFFYKIVCENEEYTSKVIECNLSPQWKEHFIFYRISDEESGVNIQLFCDTKLGFSSKIFSYSFSEKELRDKCERILPMDDPINPESETSENKLVLEIENYFISEFINA